MRILKNTTYEQIDSKYYFDKLEQNGILERIFRMLNFRRNLALVSKQFYAIVCKIDNSEDIFRARFEQDDILWENGIIENNIYASICSSQRVLTEIYLHQIYLIDIIGNTYKENYKHTLSLFSKALFKMSENVTKFTFYSCLITENQFVLILNSLSCKLKELYIIESAIIHQSFIKYRNNLEFPHLEKLDMSHTTYGNPDVSENVLEESAMYYFLRSISETSTKLRSISVWEYFVKWLSLRNFKLEHLCIQKASPNNIRLSVIVYPQIYLTSVDFLDCFIMEDVLNEILRLSFIKVLKINLQGISVQGFLKICNNKSLCELGLKCNKGSSWIVSALALANINFLKKLYLDIRDLDLNFISLSNMLNKNIQEFHILASQYFILDSIFSSHYIADVQVLTVELFIKKFRYRRMLTKYYSTPCILREFTLINRINEFTNYDCDLNLILRESTFLQKIRIEGFDISRKLLDATFESHFYLQEVYLIASRKRTCDFVFDKSFNELLSMYGKQLRIFEISCVKSMKKVKQFPFIIRRGTVLSFRHR